MTKIISIVPAIICSMHFYAYGSGLDPVDRNEIPLKVFYHQEDTAGWRTIVKGKIISIGIREERNKEDISDTSRDKTKIGVRLYSTEGVKKDDTLYVINDKNLIIAKLTVHSLFQSLSFGPMVVGYGNFRFAKIGDRVVMRQDDEKSKDAYIYTSRGNYFKETGDSAQSINHYKKAIELDKGNPEAHFELGKIYLTDGIYQLAFREFSESHKSIGRMYDREDRFQLLRYMANTRMQQAYETNLKKDMRVKFINEGIKYATDALAMKPEDTEIHYYLGVLYFKNPSPSDRDSRDHLLKVIEKEPENVNAYIILAELYYKHKNMEKSRQYADGALKIDPSNERARYIKSLSEPNE